MMGGLHEKSPISENPRDLVPNNAHCRPMASGAWPIRPQAAERRWDLPVFSGSSAQKNGRKPGCGKLP